MPVSPTLAYTPCPSCIETSFEQTDFVLSIDIRMTELVVDEEYVPVDERVKCASEEEFVLEVVGKYTCKPCPLTSNLFLRPATGHHHHRVLTLLKYQSMICKTSLPPLDFTGLISTFCLFILNYETGQEFTKVPSNHSRWIS